MPLWVSEIILFPRPRVKGQSGWRLIAFTSLIDRKLYSLNHKQNALVQSTNREDAQNRHQSDVEFQSVQYTIHQLKYDCSNRLVWHFHLTLLIEGECLLT